MNRNFAVSILALLLAVGVGFLVRRHVDKTPAHAIVFEARAPAATSQLARVMRQALQPEQQFSDPSLMELARAMEREDTDAIAGALLGGAPVNGKGKDGITPLAYALMEERLEVAEQLLRRGANPGIQMTSGTTPIQIAAMADTPTGLALCVKYGGRTDQLGQDGSTPLGVAARNHKTQNVLFLLSQPGVDVNATDRFGFTPLIKAVQANDAVAVKALLQAGANKTITAHPVGIPTTALSVARMEKNNEIIGLLSK